MPVIGTGTAQTGFGGPLGYGETEVPRSDDGALQLDLSAVFEGGLNYFGRHYGPTDVYVNTNGTLSFGAALPDYPTNANSMIDRDLIAPFWADVDTRLDGEGAESGAIWVDLDAPGNTLTVTWDNVGLYRRDATQGNTVQLQLTDRGGGDFDIVFRYDHIGWTTGSSTLDAGARAGFAHNGQVTSDWLFTATGADLTILPDLAGNSGETGLWAFTMRGGVLGVPDPRAGAVQTGTPAGDVLTGTALSDRLEGGGGNDSIYGGDGADTLIGGPGDDFIFGGATAADLRDMIYGGDGNDYLDGGYGNDELRGDAGNDTLEGGFGADTLIGGTGNDVLTGAAWGDLLYGGDGNDFINGGFGYDRVNGGAGADKFYHLGVAGHGSDWIQDYNSAAGDVLMFGGGAAASDDFLVQRAFTPNAGQAGVREIFVTQVSTGNLLWALVDGDAQAQINIQIQGQVFDLLA